MMDFNRALGLAACAVLLAACSDKAPERAKSVAATQTPAQAAPAKARPDNDGHDDEEHGGEERGAHGDEEAPAAIRLDAAEMQAAGVRVARIERTNLSEGLRAPGEVVDNAYGTTLITPRVEALVVRRHAKLGDEVAAGTPLVTLSSVEVAEAQGTLRIAEQEWKRVQALGRDAVSGRRLTEAQVAVEQARVRARAYGLPGTAQGQPNGEFTLTAPHAGRITEDSFLVGERIEPGRTLFRLVDETLVWVDAKLTPEDVQRIEVGSPAQVVLGEQRLVGKVVQRAHRTAEGTRNALVRVEVPNEGDRLHGGDFVEVYLDTGEASAPQLSVPTAALVQLEGETVVFRQDETGALVPVEVRTGAAIGDRTVIDDGITAGDTVVIEGAFVLKAQLLKSQLGEGHAH